MAANSSGSAKPRNRGKGRPFEKGKSGNPTGRPKESEETKQAKRDALEMLRAAAPDAVALLLNVMQDSSVKLDLRTKCAESVMDRVYGKASQPIEGSFGAEIRVVIDSGDDLSG